MTYKDLSEQSKIPVPTIQCIMSGRTARPRIDTIQAIERALGITNDIYSIKNIEPLPEQKLLPVIGTIACGEPILAEQNISEYLRVDERLHADFILVAKGDSMINAHIFDGAVVCIREQSDVENGEIAAVCLDDNATLKRVYKYPDKIVLRAENPLYKDIVVTENDNINVRIIGKAVYYYSEIK